MFLAGDDVQHKKPDPSIYKTAAARLAVDPAECLVIEDSTIGLQARRRRLPAVLLPERCWLLTAMRLRAGRQGSGHAVHGHLHGLHTRPGI